MLIRRRSVDEQRAPGLKRPSFIPVLITAIIIAVALLYLKTWQRHEVNPGTVHQEAAVSPKGQLAPIRPQHVPPVRPHLNPEKSPSLPAANQTNPSARADPQLKQAGETAKNAEDSAKNISNSLNPVGSALQSDSDIPLPKRVNESDFHFEAGTATLTSDSSPTLDQIASDLKLHSDATIRLEGYTDDTGDMRENQKISYARAEAIRNGLLNRGVNPAQIRIAGMGATNPIASNITQTGREENRRTDVVVVSR